MFCSSMYLPELRARISVTAAYCVMAFVYQIETSSVEARLFLLRATKWLQGAPFVF